MSPEGEARRRREGGLGLGFREKREKDWNFGVGNEDGELRRFLERRGEEECEVKMRLRAISFPLLLLSSVLCLCFVICSAILRTTSSAI